MQVKKQQLELDMEKLTGSGLGKEYDKAVYCHPVYLTYMQSKSEVAQSCPTLCDPVDGSPPGTSCEMPGWMKHKLESRLLGEISITSDMQMIPSL